MVTCIAKHDGNNLSYKNILVSNRLEGIHLFDTLWKDVNKKELESFFKEEDKESLIRTRCGIWFQQLFHYYISKKIYVIVNPKKDKVTNEEILNTLSNEIINALKKVPKELIPKINERGYHIISLNKEKIILNRVDGKKIILKDLSKNVLL